MKWQEVEATKIIQITAIRPLLIPINITKRTIKDKLKTNNRQIIITKRENIHRILSTEIIATINHNGNTRTINHLNTDDDLRKSDF